jgi:hypothetical protein
LRLARPASIASLPHCDKMRKEDRLASNKTQPTSIASLKRSNKKMLKLSKILRWIMLSQPD